MPKVPTQKSTLFIWPGLQHSGGSDPGRVGNGVLQPVLTWGSSCVPGALPGHDTWWISPVYVNSESRIPELSGCHGGPVIKVDVGDRLDLDMRLRDTTWDQKVVDTRSKESTDFSIELIPEDGGTRVRLTSAQVPASRAKGLVMQAFGRREIEGTLKTSLDELERQVSAG